MRPFISHSGVVVPLNRVDVDTDQIIPKQFLKRIERTGFGEFLFNDWRFDDKGVPKNDFELNKIGYEDATILATGRNFGSGSSREHAAWALSDYGFRCVIAPSFADIFYNNCLQNGIMLVVLPEDIVEDIIANAERSPGYSIQVDLEKQQVKNSSGEMISTFEIDQSNRYFLLRGLDHIGLTLQHEEKITAFETRLGI
jgi:3-isopropylmalate/(R)-2-methylmalate dehydratase small subunit